VEAQQEAVAAVVAAAVRGLTPEQQLELRNQLDQVLSCVSSLRGEVAELRGGLQDIATQIIQDVKLGGGASGIRHGWGLRYLLFNLPLLLLFPLFPLLLPEREWRTAGVCGGGAPASTGSAPTPAAPAPCTSRRARERRAPTRPAREGRRTWACVCE